MAPPQVRQPKDIINLLLPSSFNHLFNLTKCYSFQTQVQGNSQAYLAFYTDNVT